MDRENGTREMPGQGQVTLQIRNRVGIGGVALYAVVESVIVGAAGVDGVAVVEGIAAGALLDFFQDVSDEDNRCGEVFVVVHLKEFAESGCRLGLGLNPLKEVFGKLIGEFEVLGDFRGVGQKAGKVVVE